MTTVKQALAAGNKEFLGTAKGGATVLLVDDKFMINGVEYRFKRVTQGTVVLLKLDPYTCTEMIVSGKFTQWGMSNFHLGELRNKLTEFGIQLDEFLTGMKVKDAQGAWVDAVKTEQKKARGIKLGDIVASSENENATRYMIVRQYHRAPNEMVGCYRVTLLNVNSGEVMTTDSGYPKYDLDKDGSLPASVVEKLVPNYYIVLDAVDAGIVVEEKVEKNEGVEAVESF